MNEAQRKVTPQHLMRKAFLYVRQSTMRQVMENTESTERQYALRQRAVALGWPLEQVEVIDRDLGHSAAAAADREGFKTLVSEVGLGHAGIVMGLEVSRLARNSTDWHRLLEICALSDTLILDEDGVYDPAQFNDRLLLGLKGTMSEAELHVLKARLRGGLLNKARRGELKTALPVGFVHDAQDRVRLDPDTQVQQAIRFFFDTFQRTGTSTATVRSFGKEKIAFPRRLRAGPRKGELVWGGLTQGRALSLLRNPRYAGAFVFGRTRQRFHGDGKRVTTRKPRKEWVTLQRDAHEGYVTWAQYEENQRRLSENAQAHGLDHRRCPPREGPALLQGLLLCGVCGTGMSVRYYSRGNDLTPHYSCRGRGNKQGEPGCQNSSGAGIDAAIGPLVLEALSPLSLEVSLAVQQEIEGRLEEADGLRRKQVERARYEADLAGHRYMQVDPANRLVADELEGDWNKKLTALTQAQQEYERRRQQDRLQLDEAARARILSLATDMPRLWADPKTPQRERKQVVRFLLEDVTLLKNDGGLTLHVRFKGGATRTLNLAAPKTAWEERQTTAEVIAEIDRRLDEHTFDEIAALLNERKFVSGTGLPFHGDRVEYLCRYHKLKPRLERLREAGLLTLDELAARLGRSKHTIKAWRRQGRLPVAARKLDDNGRHMYEAPGAAGIPGELPNAADSYEVQCE